MDARKGPKRVRVGAETVARRRKGEGRPVGENPRVKKHPRAGKTRRDRRRGRGYLRATYTAKEYARDDRRVVSAVTPQKRRSASARPIPMLGYHLKGEQECVQQE